MTLKIDEHTQDDGSLAGIFLEKDEVGLAIAVGGGSPARHPLPEGALEAVMARFGKALEPTEKLTFVAELELGDGRRLRHARHLARYDVIARDFLIYEAPGDEPLAALATWVAGALVHLGGAASGGRA